uniref:RagB/SusD family nutrient uptake outer membrane protein n=1 Tax=uncultured Bacteroides sp. TaxID=162156 RepID=UPI00266EEA29
MKAKNILLGLALILGTTSCYDLDKMPEGVLSTAEPFRSTGEIRNYIDRFYESALRGQGFQIGGGQGIAGDDVGSDNMSSNAANTRLMGMTALSNASRLSNYEKIRDVNFLLNNADECPEKGTPTYNQLMGEVYYFRAWYYYTMFTNYGCLAWVDKPLDPDMSVMMLPRESRTFIVDKILNDLDTAIGLMSEQNNSGTMRLHRDVARAFKSEVALFEATWEKYHYAKEKDKAEKFYDTTLDESALRAKIDNYLTQAIAAAEAVCNRGVWDIYKTGNVNKDYRVLFETEDLTRNPEVLWFKRYDGNQIGNNVTRSLNCGAGSANSLRIGFNSVFR